MNNYNIKRITEDYTDEDWKKYYQFRLKYAERNNETLQFETWELLKERNLKGLERGSGLYHVWRDEEEAGYFTFEHNFKHKPKKHFVYFSSDKHLALTDDFFKAMFKTLFVFAPSFPKMAFISTNKKNEWMVEKFNAVLGSHIELFELNVAEANEETIDAWLKEAESKFPDYKLKFFIDIPDPLLEEYCAVFLELLYDMPAISNIKEFNMNVDKIKSRQAFARQRNHCSYRYMVYNKEDKLIAKTNVFINRNKPQVLHQYMTGALKDYRRQGLGKWMKAAMYKRLRMDFPELEKIETETSVDNIGSRELSRKMGYKKTGLEKEYFIDREKILTFMKR